MPVYEYQCKACQKEFEYQQRMSDPEKTTCEACGAEKLERLISRTAFSLKGGGWYKDLYSSSKPESKSSDTASTKSDSTAASSSDSSAASSTTSSTPSTTTSTTPSSGSSSGSGGSTSKSAASGAK